MLSVIIETRNDEDGLARSLAPLVPAVVEGLVREVIICDHDSTDGTLKVAEHAGCRVVTGEVAEAIRAAKSEWLLLLEPGARLTGDWQDPVAAHIARNTMPASFSRSRESRPGLFARVFASALATGLVVTKRQALSRARPGQGAEGVARGLAVRRLEARLSPAPGR